MFYQSSNAVVASLALVNESANKDNKTVMQELGRFYEYIISVIQHLYCVANVGQYEPANRELERFHEYVLSLIQYRCCVVDVGQ
jgi:hypothetical protein